MALKILPTIFYLFASGITLAIGIVLVEYFTTRSYQMVTVFITLIILSNCFAQLYTLHFVNKTYGTFLK